MQTVQLHLRPITDTDQAFLQQLYATTRIDELAAVPWDEAAKVAFLLQQFQAQHSYYQAHYQDADFALICQAEQPIGRLYLFRGPSTFNLIDISLLPPWRGLGIGSAYLREITREADAQGKSIRLFVEPENPARRLYERFGFQQSGRRQLYLQMYRDAGACTAAEARV
ncbi:MULTISPECIES: GNAT family N-acetyltransferase [Pseudomonas]|uniref:Acetyltransferase (GNAT) family protein n=1 Tax=Pseudomonas putida TaxID=303 RepID=A0A1B2F352_PSEPU|nr:MULTISPECIES: N-acetyltransferase [Pseudomonas]ANY86631.1 Acetyltransferase (GNAT) family protein [Pseudomonas putida]MCL8308526.1 GNAT family N-acetyltransferase [Pseudomonas putida]